MESNCADSTIEQLTKLLSRPCLTLPMKHQIQDLQLELRFLKMFFYCSTKFSGPDEDIMGVKSVQNNAESTLESAGKALYQAGYFAIIGIDVKDWDRLASDLLQKVCMLKPEIRRLCIHWLESSSQTKSSTSDEILEFMDSILVNLKDLVSLKADIVVPVKIQIRSLENKLRFSRNFVDFTAKRCISHGKLEDFLTYIQAWANSAACMLLRYWVDFMNENMELHLKAVLSATLLKVMPSTPAVAEMYLELLKASKSLPTDALLMGEIVASFIDFLLENLALSLKDKYAILREGLIFLMIFLLDPPKECTRKTENVSWTNVDILNSLVESLVCSLYTDPTEDDTSKRDVLSDLLEKIEKVKVEVRALYLETSSSSQSNFPKINGMGFIDFLTVDFTDIVKCEASFIPFAENKVMTVHEELLYFRSFLCDIMNLQNKHEELKALWTQIINLAYQVENVISSFSIVDIPIWYNIIRFSNMLEEIKLVKNEVTKLKQKYNIGKRIAETNSMHGHPSQVKTSKIDETVVGFMDEAKEIIRLLTGPSRRLEIVAIVGMPGVGKTTLAKKVYNDPFLASRFQIQAWCFVSQVYTPRDLLLAILKTVIDSGRDVDLSKFSDGDLALKLKQCLSKQKYLVVMDDIWEIKAWNDIKLSFPDDRTESRIMFTSQNRILASDAGLTSNTYPLSPLTEEKSWEFLREKLFLKGDCPHELSRIGEQIVKHCEGLPLAISVIAGLLAKEKKNVNWWNQVEGSLHSNATSDGYMGTLELSFTHLSYSLKPCFLYFGSFQKGEVISAQKLTLLWSAEGLIKRTERESSQILAKGYLTELRDRSLVIVSERSFDGGIKACRVHDLLYDFCAGKAKDEKFLHVAEKSEVSHSSLDPATHGYCRLCIHGDLEAFMSSVPPCPCVCSLQFFGTTRWNQSYSNLVGSDIFNRFKFLKVLNLERVCLDCPFPEEVISIIRLRYIAIWGYITAVPASLAKLRKLETLIVKGMEKFIHLPDTIWKMKSLMHVEVSETAVLSLGDYEDEESCQLGNMVTFASLSLSHVGDTEKLLGRLRRVQKLRCVLMESKDYQKTGIQFPALSSLEDLQSLQLSIDGSHEQVFYCWLRIQFKGFSFPSGLRKLTLYKLGLPWRAMSTIRKLRFLEVLKLRQHSFRGKIWNMEGEEFRKLKFLEVSNLDIVHWKARTNPLPSLEQLVVGECLELVEIPFRFAEIQDLEEILLRRYNNELLKSAQEIVEEAMIEDGREIRLLKFR
ncbi:putative late blight resistance protein homolog R1A-3 [Coffea eugenioides]|uniref:putative late blight resistance protein homolog R1A-3 n=1 Tax=Coffea eugenioides TaxID=49369 RepID=UPI000F60FA4D|nr:putative late blight resistance protein homolog R1A-3 [Coffea eugenioides]